MKMWPSRPRLEEMAQAGTACRQVVAARAPVAILVGIALVAVARGSTQAMVTALTGDLVRQEQRGRAIGLVHTASDLGSAIGPPIAYALLPWMGLPGVYLLCAALYAAELAIVCLRPGRPAIRVKPPA